MNVCEIKKQKILKNLTYTQVHSVALTGENCWKRRPMKILKTPHERKKASSGVVFALSFPFSNISTNNKWALQGGLCFHTGLPIFLLLQLHYYVCLRNKTQSYKKCVTEKVSKAYCHGRFHNGFQYTC